MSAKNNSNNFSTPPTVSGTTALILPGTVAPFARTSWILILAPKMAVLCNYNHIVDCINSKSHNFWRENSKQDAKHWIFKQFWI